MGGERVVVLGGGMGGLSAAWELSSGPWRERYSSITVYQRGWRLGGKGASSRGEHGRIEEHGLHVLLGYYDATFRVLREVYAELDRRRTDPGCPLPTLWDAVEPSGDIGLVDRDGATLTPFVTRFSGNDQRPGEPGAEDRELAPLEVAVRALRLLADFHSPPSPAGRVHLSASPEPDRQPGGAAHLLRVGGLTTLAGVAEAVERAAGVVDGTGVQAPMLGVLTGALQTCRAEVRRAVRSSPQAWRTWELVDLVCSTVVGMAVDGLLSGRGYERIDHLDFREWLAGHGAAPRTLDSPIIRGMYDLTFAYEGGDRTRPRFAAGLGLQLAARMLFDHKGAVFWRMQAGMGEVVFAPLYEALRRRGVQFRFFHRLDHVRLTADHGDVAAVELTRQAEPAPGCRDYEPLVRHHGLPVWPAAPLLDQLAADPGPHTETHVQGVRGGERVVLEAGRDFDVAVLAVSLGMVPVVAADLVEALPRWRTMVEEVATVATRAAQLWLQETDEQLGWPGPDGVTLSGFGDTFDTWASMGHLLRVEGWPSGSSPRGLAYFCGAMPDAPDQAMGDRFVRASLSRFLETEVAGLWPRAVDAEGFRWGLLHAPEGLSGVARLSAQHLRANLDPSDRYVQSLPGSGRHRMAPDGTGLGNLAVAGDWTACGLDAGCLEAAVRSGVLAARALASRRVRPADSAEGVA